MQHSGLAISGRKGLVAGLGRLLGPLSLLILTGGTLAVGVTARGEESSVADEESAITVPTPPDVVAKMLEVAKLSERDVLYDLGCGDGRIVVEAALRYGCRAVGYEIDPGKVRESRENVNKHGVSRLVTIEQQDIFQLDLRKASVITLYLLPEMNDRLVPQLKKLREGSRIVCHEFPIDAYQHEKMVTIKSTYDGVPRDVYLYTLPLVAKPLAD